MLREERLGEGRHRAPVPAQLTSPGSGVRRGRREGFASGLPGLEQVDAPPFPPAGPPRQDPIGHSLLPGPSHLHRPPIIGAHLWLKGTAHKRASDQISPQMKTLQGLPAALRVTRYQALPGPAL